MIFLSFSLICFGLYDCLLVCLSAFALPMCFGYGHKLPHSTGAMIHKYQWVSGADRGSNFHNIGQGKMRAVKSWNGLFHIFEFIPFKDLFVLRVFSLLVSPFISVTCLFVVLRATPQPCAGPQLFLYFQLYFSMKYKSQEPLLGWPECEVVSWHLLSSLWSQLCRPQAS